MTSRIIDTRPAEDFVHACQYHLAKNYHAVLMKNIHDFKQRLSQTQEIGATITQGEHTEELYLDTVQYSDPNLLIITGEDFNGKPIELLQDASHISITLHALPKRAAKSLLLEMEDFSKE
jgi:hypothetical protein